VRAQYVTNVAITIFQLVSVVVGLMLGGLLGLIIARVVTRFTGGILTAIFYYIDF
jgi:hypothetical protein